jgi:hypothetical protein
LDFTSMTSRRSYLRSSCVIGGEDVWIVGLYNGV